MPLKFDILNSDERGYEVLIRTDKASINVNATEPELRRLLIDLQHEFANQSAEPDTEK